VPELYTDAPTATYFYRGGVNPRAIAAFVPAAIVALAIAFVPLFKPVSPFSWFFGAGIAALSYYVLADRHRDYHDVSGEPIAIPSVH